MYPLELDAHRHMRLSLAVLSVYSCRLQFIHSYLFFSSTHSLGSFRFVLLWYISTFFTSLKSTLSVVRVIFARIIFKLTVPINGPCGRPEVPEERILLVLQFCKANILSPIGMRTQFSIQVSDLWLVIPLRLSFLVIQSYLSSEDDQKMTWIHHYFSICFLFCSMSVKDVRLV